MSKLSKTCSSIQNRKKPSDVFYTPTELVDESIKMCIEGVHTINDAIWSSFGDYQSIRSVSWYDPFKGLGAYYDKYPLLIDAHGEYGGPDDECKRIACKKDWAEIVLGKDFYIYTPEWGENDIKIICSNPPYSCLNAVVMRCIELKPDIINLTLGSMNLTRTRINLFKSNGYTLSKISITDVKGWFGITNIVQFEKTCNSPTTSCNYLVRDDGKAYEYKPEIVEEVEEVDELICGSNNGGGCGSKGWKLDSGAIQFGCECGEVEETTKCLCGYKICGPDEDCPYQKEGVDHDGGGPDERCDGCGKSDLSCRCGAGSPWY